MAKDELEDRIVAALRSEGLIDGQRRSSRSWRINVGAGLVGMVGLATAFWVPDRDRPAAADHEVYLLALYEGPNYRSAGASEPTRAEEYARWAEAHRDGGAVVVDGEELGAVVAVLGEPVDRSEIAGFFQVRAESRDAAVALAKSTPHLRYGGTVVVRETVP